MMGYIQGTGMRYDILWCGETIINNKRYKFKTIDLTDYITMDDTCPYCSLEEHNQEMVKYCHCETYVELICILGE
jgi:hypothetical protein